jgi:hypothetical protein
MTAQYRQKYDPALESWLREEIFLFTKLYTPALGPPQRPIQWVRWGSSQGVDLAGRALNNLPPSTAEFKNKWSYILFPLYAFMEWRATSFTFHFTFQWKRTGCCILDKWQI